MAHLTTISGTYRDGVIELSERPAGVSAGARVLVTFLDEAELPAIDPRQASSERLIARMKAGIPFGGAPYPSREELHERREPAQGSR
jgi:hypothetical protein